MYSQPPSYMLLFPNVQSYLRWIESPDARLFRPSFCPHCQGTQWHRHGRYYRDVCTDREIHDIPVQRFLCPLCGHTLSLLPSFVGPRQSFTWDVQQQVVSSGEHGQTAAQAAAAVASPAGPVSQRTVVRWHRLWRDRLASWESWFWGLVLRWFPSLSLLTSVSLLAAFRHAWEQTLAWHPPVALFHGLVWLRHSSASSPLGASIPHKLSLAGAGGAAPQSS